MDFGSFWGTPLGVVDYGRDNSFPCVDY